MLDFELAKIYGYETKRFNEQVKNNINRFPERYRFQITNEELKEIARSQNVTAQIWATNKGGRTVCWVPNIRYRLFLSFYICAQM